MARRVLAVAKGGLLEAPAGAVGISVRGGEYGTKVLGAMAGGRPTWIRDLGRVIAGRGGGGVSLTRLPPTSDDNLKSKIVNYTSGQPAINWLRLGF